MSPTFRPGCPGLRRISQILKPSVTVSNSKPAPSSSSTRSSRRRVAPSFGASACVAFGSGLAKGGSGGQAPPVQSFSNKGGSDSVAINKNQQNELTKYDKMDQHKSIQGSATPLRSQKSAPSCTCGVCSKSPLAPLDRLFVRRHAHSPAGLSLPSWHAARKFAPKAVGDSFRPLSC